jgi:hypothetical protein
MHRSTGIIIHTTLKSERSIYQLIEIIGLLILLSMRKIEAFHSKGKEREALEAHGWRKHHKWVRKLHAHDT